MTASTKMPSNCARITRVRIQTASDGSIREWREALLPWRNSCQPRHCSRRRVAHEENLIGSTMGFEDAAAVQVRPDGDIRHPISLEKSMKRIDAAAWTWKRRRRTRPSWVHEEKEDLSARRRSSSLADRDVRSELIGEHWREASSPELTFGEHDITENTRENPSPPPFDFLRYHRSSDQ
jgi:hypothetical protein